MTKSNKKNRVVDQTEAWMKAIHNSEEERRKVDASLSPSRDSIRYVVDYAKTIDDTVQLIKNTSNLAHQGVIEFEVAQRIIDNQKKALLRDIKWLETFLKQDDEEEKGE
ncbi:hypothetical protein [Paenibacillus sp. LK1]|uniref:hypothetical protein n=1 Tax=Paenibacillus sp. LK1 TaxID=2053014 RepID=UPI000C1A25C1|nr:hypothetical protein [Paenibacillus sp. LK1]PIH59015.1 hypothetical protein CS562_13805 [Paenibacillus sp. LK1]